MTNENRKQNIAEELARADASLRAAAALIPLALSADAVSRANYGAFHVLRALALSRGIETRTHSGLIHVFNTEMVRPGHMPSSFNRLLSGLQRARELADYDAAVVFSVEDAQAELDEARRFAAAAEKLLRDQGWLV